VIIRNSDSANSLAGSYIHFSLWGEDDREQEHLNKNDRE
jgi:hypothetical protein